MRFSRWADDREKHWPSTANVSYSSLQGMALHHADKADVFGFGQWSRKKCFHCSECRRSPNCMRISMLNLIEDVRYALRGLQKSPLFTIVALASLAIGIGANTAVFSLMDQALLRSLLVKNPEQLVLFRAPGPRRG